MSEEPKVEHPLVEATAAEAESADKLEHKALQTLGEVAAGHSNEVHVDANGTVMTPREVAEIRNGNH
jgi:hypothetical protein